MGVHFSCQYALAHSPPTHHLSDSKCLWNSWKMLFVGKRCVSVELERKTELCNVGTSGPLSWLVGLAEHAEGQILPSLFSDTSLLKPFWNLYGKKYLFSKNYLFTFHVLDISLQIWYIFYTHTFQEGPRIFLRKKALQRKLKHQKMQCLLYCNVRCSESNRGMSCNIEISCPKWSWILIFATGWRKRKQYPASDKMKVVYTTSPF